MPNSALLPTLLYKISENQFALKAAIMDCPNGCSSKDRQKSPTMRGALNCLTANPIRGCRLYFNNRQNVFRRFFGLKSPPN